jgi:hypothetical protein
MTRMTTRPLPALQADPAFAAANEARATYASDAARVRGDFTLSDLGRAEQIVTLWEAASAAITAAYNDLSSRRRARLAELEAVVPVGPAVPADASPADSALLFEIFQRALDQARDRAADEDSLRAMLSDAERFGDDTRRRAALTAAVDSGQVRIVREWCAQRGLSDQLDELITVRSDLAGYGDTATHLYEVQAFGVIPRPDEVAALPGLRQAAAVTAQQATRTTNIGKGWH